jgi:hypothetical protein
MTPAPGPDEHPAVVSESPEAAAATHPELARHAAELTGADNRRARRLLWKEAAVVAIIVLLLVVREIWFV